MHPGEVVVRDAAVEVCADRLAHAAPPETVAPLEALLPLVMHVGVVSLDKAVERRRLGDARTVKPTWRSGHGSPLSRGMDG